ncbi:LPXTG cell wall anchor domain-containing protein [Arthrobacter yangruifuii]|uniref:LPXTG cell wall anchor domain-containing protein n=1 Tax=Arthrobacter yangruifuii TaxID=2606616 RepID=A0A5N6MG17_9MICC|nr:LPXTG cell wall anchor domain-containing protein [Arthrobacter yangruifuii]KAD3515254.1 LPXTG cell wall anchor domain-containing protein [Arthrobacter yangruifuii]
MKKTVSALVLAGSLAFVGAGAANAVSSYPAPVTGSVSATIVTPGATIVFSGAGFTGGEQIRIDVTYANDPQIVAGTGISSPIILAQLVGTNTVVANPDGSFSADVTLGDAPGTYTLTATGLTSGHQVTAAVVVDPAAAGGAGTGSGAGTGVGTGTNASADNGLANTGADSAMMLWGAAGVLALGAGVATVTVARRKNA